ncbi:MAG: cobalamin-binding protein [Chloroflexota bacterium]|nr:cobalamin-binding protein [Chloroflexota bacterium]
MRICSLLPSTTEIVCSLGLRDSLVGITHECDYPPGISNVPVVTESIIDHTNSTSIEIDRHISAAVHSGSGIYSIKDVVLNASKPDLILTQELCEVCAVSYSMVESSVKELKGKQTVLSFEPTNLEGIFESIERIGHFTNVDDISKPLVKDLRSRVSHVAKRAAVANEKPHVLGLEWLDPPFIGGHWVPEMIGSAGGKDVIGLSEKPSRQISWQEASASNPEIVVLMVCGFDLSKTVAEFCSAKIGPFWDNFEGSIFAADGSSFFSRPGPRIVDGLEILAEIIHPELFPRRHSEDDWVKMT